MNEAIRQDVKKACEVMQKGGIILYPTDTILGNRLRCNQCRSCEACV